jgi:hypothetical protein
MLYSENSKENKLCFNSNCSHTEEVNNSKNSIKTPYFPQENLFMLDRNNGFEEEMVLSVSGSFLHDIPNKVSKFSVDEKDNKIFALIDWKGRYDSS